MTISELIKELEKIKAEHGDLPVKTWCHGEYSEQYYLDDIDFPEYHEPDEDAECVVIGE